MRGNAALLLGCAVAAAATQVLLQSAYRAAGAPVSLLAYGLQGDATVLRGWYADLGPRGVAALIRAELIDLVWAVTLGLTIVALVWVVGRAGAGVAPRLSAALLAWAPLFALGPAVDLVENGFSLAMLTDPVGFPGWWATAHGVAARVKLALSGLSALLGAVSIATVAVASRRAQRQRHTDHAEAALPSP